MINQLVTLYPITTFLYFGVCCLAIGSLLNVIIYRLPLILQNECSAHEHENKPAHRLNLFFPRSFCPACKHQIPMWHNIPLISYLILRGRCHACHQKIPYRYPLVEASCLILSLLAAWVFGFNLTLMFALLFIWMLICLCVIDLEHQILPDSLTLTLLWLGLLANTQALFTSLPNAVYSAAGAYMALWLFMKLFYLIRHKEGMGHGDFKLFAAFGAWFGWTQLPIILLIASTTGAVIGLFYLKRTQQTQETPIPFGPFLCFAGLLSLFYGSAILQWYLTFLAH